MSIMFYSTQVYYLLKGSVHTIGKMYPWRDMYRNKHVKVSTSGMQLFSGSADFLFFKSILVL